MSLPTTTLTPELGERIRSKGGVWGVFMGGCIFGADDGHNVYSVRWEDEGELVAWVSLHKIHRAPSGNWQVGQVGQAPTRPFRYRTFQVDPLLHSSLRRRARGVHWPCCLLCALRN